MKAEKYLILLLLIIPVTLRGAGKVSSRSGKLHISSRQAYFKSPEGPRRPLTIGFQDVPLKEKGMISVLINGNTITERVGNGIKETELLLPAGEIKKATDVKISFKTARLKIDTTYTVKPARFWTLYFLPHSHNDIGYTQVQEEVMKVQWENLEKAIDLCKRTQSYPDGSQFRWNSEVLWAVENFIKNAPEDKVRELIDAVKKGWIELDGMYANMLTGLCRDEELMHVFDAANLFREKYGINIEPAMITDVPGYSWGIVPAMAQNGVRYFSVGPNYVPSFANLGDRVGLVHKAWGDIPFYWISPSGNEKILYWSTGKGYSWFHKWIMDKLSVCGEAPVFQYLGELQDKDYPYDLSYLRYTIGGDNGPPDEEMPDFIRKWNEKYEWPKLRIATVTEAFKALENKYSKVIPEFSGDFTPYWEDGAASSAKETAMNRNTADRLVQADVLWTILQNDNYPAEDFYNAWQNVLLYSEHTWGAHNSISEPFSDFVKKQWEGKQRFALNAADIADKLFNKALSPIRVSDNNVESFQVLNTSSWKRTGIVTIPADWNIAGKIVSDCNGKPVVIQKLSSGGWAFVAKDIPPLGSAKYILKKSKTKQKRLPYFVRAEGNKLINPYYEIEIDSVTGNIVRLYDIKRKINYAGSQGLNAFYYSGKNGADVRSDKNIKISLKENGPVLVTLSVESDAPGAKKLTREITLYSDLDIIGIKNIIDKEIVTAKENVRFAFPFAVRGGDARVDLAWADMQPEKDQLKGSNKNFFTIQNWLDINNKSNGITLISPDAPIIEIGGMNGEKWMSSPDQPWFEKYNPSPLVYSWVMNNSWHTNYRAFQDGITGFRYDLKPHDEFSPTESKKIAEEICRPLIPVITDPKTKPFEPLFFIGNDSPVVVASIKESNQPGFIMIRLFNTSEKPAEVKIKWNRLTPSEVFLSNPEETRVSEAPGTLIFKPFDIITLKLKPQASK